MAQPEGMNLQRRRWPAILAVSLVIAVIAVAGYAEWRHQHPPYYVGATFENVTVRPDNIACLLSGESFPWHSIMLGDEHFELTGGDPFPPGQAVSGTLRITAVSDLRPVAADAEFTSGGTTTAFKTFGNKFHSVTCE